jgi:two-component system nitrogen regulation sensor histidine kinase NtrY
VSARPSRTRSRGGSLRRRFLLYLVLLHLVFAAASVAFLRGHRVWLLAVEALFAVSFVTALRLLRATIAPLELARSGAELLRESDFTSRLRPVGQPEVDQLVDLYNTMVDHLREERTRQQEQHLFLDRILAASPSGVVVLDFDGRIAATNPAAERLVGAAGPALQGVRLDELGSSFARRLQELPLDEPQVLPLQGRRRVKCQRSRFMDRGFPRDFLMLEELTEELRRSEKAAYEKLIRMLSHEVNNTTGAVASLLHACLSYGGQLREPDRGEFAQALEVAIGRTRRMSDFMQGFADVVRLPPPHRRPTDLRRLLEGVVALLAIDARRRAIELRWAVEQEPPELLMDPAQMEQVFLNVLKNATEAIGERGTITLRLARVGGRARVAIEDSGGGIPPAVRDQLFAPFFTTKENGQGIGLTLVREILVAHRFEFALEGRDGGAEFTVTF